MNMTKIMTRRSCRKFLARPVEREKIESLLRAGMQAPSGKDARPWQFIAVTKPDILEALSKASPYAVSAANAPAAIVLLADFQKEERDVMWWPQSLSACAENILLQAEEEGLGAAWLGIWPIEERITHIRNLFQLPEYLEPFAVVTFGYKQKEKPFDNRWDPSLVHWNALEQKSEV